MSNAEITAFAHRLRYIANVAFNAEITEGEALGFVAAMASGLDLPALQAGLFDLLKDMQKCHSAFGDKRSFEEAVQDSFSGFSLPDCESNEEDGSVQEAGDLEAFIQEEGAEDELPAGLQKMMVRQEKNFSMVALVVKIPEEDQIDAIESVISDISKDLPRLLKEGREVAKTLMGGAAANEKRTLH